MSDAGNLVIANSTLTRGWTRQSMRSERQATRALILKLSTPVMRAVITDSEAQMDLVLRSRRDIPAEDFHRNLQHSRFRIIQVIVKPNIK